MSFLKSQKMIDIPRAKEIWHLFWLIHLTVMKLVQNVQSFHFLHVDRNWIFINNCNFTLILGQKFFVDIYQDLTIYLLLSF